MYSTLFQAIAIGATFATRFVAADLEVLTPQLVQCQNATVHFSGGKPNYLISVVPSDDPCSDSLLDIPQTISTSVQFLVSLAAGTSVDIVVDSADGEEGWSATTVVQAGKDSSCLSKAPASASSKSPSSPNSTPTVSASSASSASAASSAITTPSSPTSSPTADPFAAPPPPAVQSGTIGSGPGSDSPVNVGSNPNSNNTTTNTSGTMSRMTLSVGSLMASVLFAFAASRL